jgi:sulfate transport system ATP-binding protein
VPGRLTRALRVGFEVRLEITTAHEVVSATMSRAAFQALGIEAGSDVSVRPVHGATAVQADEPLLDVRGDELLAASH